MEFIWNLRLPRFAAQAGIVAALSASGCSFDDPPSEAGEARSDITRGPEGLSFNQGWRVDQHVRDVRDVDADGRADLIGFGNDGVWLAENQSGSFAAPALVVTGLGNNQGYTSENSIRMLADVNGDGRPDVVVFSATSVQVALKNTGAGFAAPAVWSTEYTFAGGWRIGQHTLTVADVNADGKADIVGVDDWGTYVSLSQGTGFGAKKLWIREFSTSQLWDRTRHPLVVADINNDGRADILGFGNSAVWASLSTGTTFTPLATVGPGFGYLDGWHIGEHIRVLANVDGDRYPDIVGIGANAVVVAHGGAGGLFGAPTSWSGEFTVATGWDRTRHPRFIADVDGDGMADLLGIKDDQVLLARSTGTAFAAPQAVLSELTYNKGWRVDKHPRFVADVDGDGELDLVGFFDDAVYWDRLTPPAVPLPPSWETPGCSPDRLNPPAPAICEGPWSYSRVQRCVSVDPACPQYCSDFKACALWENGAVQSGQTIINTNIVGPDTRGCVQTCRNGVCQSPSCGGNITPPTAACQGRADTIKNDLRTAIFNAVMGEPNFDSAAAQSTRAAQARDLVVTAPIMGIFKTNFTIQNGPAGIQIRNWTEQYGCNISQLSAVQVTADNDACGCDAVLNSSCEHDCGSTVQYTEPGKERPASPYISGQTCLTHDDLPQTTTLEVQAKFDALWTTYAAAPPPVPGVPAETFKRAMVSRLKLMYELFADRLLDQHTATDQVHRAISLYRDRPDDYPACALDIDAPAVPVGCTNPAVAGTRGDLIRCQRLLATHAAESAASLASADCTALLTGYLGLRSQTADDATCGGPHLRELGATTVFKLEDKQLGVINSAPTTLGSLARQLWLLDAWYASSKAAEAAGVFPEPDQQRRDTSFLLGQFWDRVRANTTADAALEGLSQSTTPDEAEQALGLSAAASRTSEQSVISALFTVPPTIQPENVTLTRPPLRSLPLLAMIGDALRPLIDDLDGLAVYHDIACQFRDCRAPNTNTPSRNAWKLLANLEAASLVNDVTATPSALAGWKPAFAKLAAQQSAFTQAAADAVTGAANLAGATQESQVHPLARPLWTLYKHARAFRDHYEATGLFESSAQPQLQGSVLQQEQAHVVTTLRNRATALSNRVVEYRNGLVAALQGQIAVMDAGARIQDLNSQRMHKGEEMDQKSRNLEGLRAAGEDEEDAFGSLAKSFADIQHALDEGAYVQVGDSATLALTGRDGRYGGTGPVNLGAVAVHSIPSLTPGQMVVVNTSGSWTPTCALQTASFFRVPGEDPVPADLANAAIGPEGYAITTSGGQVAAHSSGHSGGYEAAVGQSVKFCSDTGLLGQAFGLELEECIFAQHQMTFNASAHFSSGEDARTTASFAAGIRLPGTPFIEAPAGSLLVVLADPATSQVRDIKVVHSGGTSVIVEQPSTAYVVVNDRQCTTSGNTLSLGVSVRTMMSQTAIAEKALISMAEVLTYMRQQRTLLVNQGVLLPSQATLLRQQANLKLQAHLDEIDVASLPGPLASLFEAFVSHQIVATERQIQGTAIERSLDLDLIELRTIDDEINAGAAHARLQRLVPQWILRNLPHDTLRHNLVDVLSVSRDFLKPILELWYPHALDGVSFGPEISALLNADVDTSLVTLAGNGATFVNALLDAYEDATFGAKPPGQQLPVVVVNFHRPGFARPPEPVWREADDARAARVWDAIDRRQVAHFEISPEDFYSNNGGDAILPCTEVIPVIKTMEVYAVRPDADTENQILNGFNRIFHGFAGVSQSFVAPEGPKVYELADSLWQNFDLPVRYGIYELPVTTFNATPRQSRPVGLSANGAFDLDFSILNTLPNHGRFDASEVSPVTDIQLVMELDSRAVGTRPTWVNRCR